MQALPTSVHTHQLVVECNAANSPPGPVNGWNHSPGVGPWFPSPDANMRSNLQDGTELACTFMIWTTGGWFARNTSILLYTMHEKILQRYQLSWPVAKCSGGLDSTVSLFISKTTQNQIQNFCVFRYPRPCLPRPLKYCQILKAVITFCCPCLSWWLPGNQFIHQY